MRYILIIFVVLILGLNATECFSKVYKVTAQNKAVVSYAEVTKGELQSTYNNAKQEYQDMVDYTETLRSNKRDVYIQALKDLNDFDFVKYNQGINWD